MTLRLVHRPTRVTRPLQRADAEVISPPPAMQDGAQGGVPIQALLPVLGAGTSVIMMVTLRGNALFMARPPAPGGCSANATSTTSRGCGPGCVSAASPCAPPPNCSTRTPPR
ncbi:hypothetical protein [Cryobacterium inferilacus]|uniref:hypothetical protein n=1 Tax=Cryobacterium inferilacus TaxID=2866629 RepID=UPI0021052BCF|nr:hypothetical protein [Cryobacterium sp. 1639]